MKRVFGIVLAATVIMGCVSSGPAPKEVQLREVNMYKVEDISSGFLAARLVDTTFTLAGLLGSESRFLLSLKNLDTEEILWMRFRAKSKDSFLDIDCSFDGSSPSQA